MDSLIQYFAGYNIDFVLLLKSCGLLLAATIIISVLGRLLFGRNSLLSLSVSAAIGILFVYMLQVVLYSFESPYSAYIPPLPFTSFHEDTLNLFVFRGAPYTIVCFQLLSTIILAFIMNLFNRIIPSGRNILTWLGFRVLTILTTVFVHNIVVGLFIKFMPQGIVTYAPVILLAILIVMLLTGALKLLVGALMATVNPFIAALYTFFFASLIGKQITCAVFTTAILSLLVYFLNTMGITTISIASAGLVAYIPFALILVAMWYIVRGNK